MASSHRLWHTTFLQEGSPLKPLCYDLVNTKEMRICGKPFVLGSYAN